MNNDINSNVLENRTVRVEYTDHSGKIACHQALAERQENDQWRLIFNLKDLPIINPGTKIILAVIDEERQREVHFKTVVTDVFFGKATIYTARPEPVDISSLRQFFRCQVCFPVQLDMGAKPVSGSACDLSAGGIRVELAEEANVTNGRRLSCQFKLPGCAQPITIRGEVVRIERGEEGHLSIAVRFLVIHEKNRSDILQFLFRCQREALQAHRKR